MFLCLKLTFPLATHLHLLQIQRMYLLVHIALYSKYNTTKEQNRSLAYVMTSGSHGYWNNFWSSFI